MRQWQRENVLIWDKSILIFIIIYIYKLNFINFNIFKFILDKLMGKSYFGNYIWLVENIDRTV